MKTYYITLFLLLFSASYSQETTDKNYVLNRTFVREVANGEMSVPADYFTTISYLDGFEREIQTINLKAGGNGEDIISVFEYDPIDRQHKQYLPFAIMGNNS